MSKLSLKNILIIVLILQIGIVLLVGSSSSVLDVQTKTNQLVSFDPAGINKFKIEEKSASIEIDKTADGWILTGYENFPADTKKIEKVFSDLANLKATSPVATSLSAAKKLKTGVNEFEKKVSLISSNSEEVIFFGTSPTFKKLYARVNGTDDTYIVDYQAADLGLNVINWFNADLLKFNVSELEMVRFNEINLIKENNNLVFEELAEDYEANKKELEGFLNKLSEVTYIELPKKSAPAKWDSIPEVAKISLKIKGQELEWQFKGPITEKIGEDEKTKYFLKSSALPYYFELSKYEFDSVMAYNKERLISKIVKDSESASEEGSAKE